MDLGKTNSLQNRVDILHLEIINSASLYLKKIEPILTKYNITSEELIQELIKYFIVIEKSTQMTSPSYIIDLAWHELILFTRFYEHFCVNHFNKFIHHTPSENENVEIYQYTLNQYNSLFGIPSKEIWTPTTKMDWESINCGACHN